MRAGDHWNRFVDGWTRFDHGFRHLMARRPALVGFAQGLLVGLVLWFRPQQDGFLGLAFAVVSGLVFAAFAAYAWRPGGTARLRYERWCARVEGRPDVPLLADGETAPGWYGDPARRGRIAYWTGDRWA